MVANPEMRIRVHGTQYLLESLNADDRLLLVDDVFSSGKTLEIVQSRLTQRLKRNMPKDTKTATVWTRTSGDAGGRKPDYYVHETDSWLVLPYELTGLTSEEIKVPTSRLLRIFWIIRNPESHSRQMLRNFRRHPHNLDLALRYRQQTNPTGFQALMFE